MISGTMRIFDLVEKNTLTQGVVRDFPVCSTTTPNRPEVNFTNDPIG